MLNITRIIIRPTLTCKFSSLLGVDDWTNAGTLANSFWQRGRKGVGNEKIAFFATRISGDVLIITLFLNNV